MKKGQTPKSPAHKKNLLTLMIVIFGAVRDKLFASSINLQFLALMIFMIVVFAVTGGAHG